MRSSRSRNSVARNEFYLALAKELEAAPKGERGPVVDRVAETLGISQKSVYRRLKTLAGYAPDRKPRKDSGTGKTPQNLALAVSAIVTKGIRANGKRTISVKDAVKNLEDQGHGAVNPETGEVVMPSTSTVLRAMRQAGVHPDQIVYGSPHVTMRSLHPNHVWQADASVCVLWYLPGDKKLRLMDERKYNEKKPHHLAKIINYRIVRYLLADHTTHTLYLWYERSSGENATGMLTTLINAMTDRGGRDPMHGVPKILYLDPSGGNQSGLMRDFCKNLGIELLIHEAGNAQATGSVEVGQNLVERGFEGWLRFASVNDLASLQTLADAWRLHFNAHEIHTRLKMPRNRAWLRITDEQLRTAPGDVLRALANWGAVSRPIRPDFTITVDTRTSFGTRQYDLRMLGYDGLNIGDAVAVTLNPFNAPEIVVAKTMPNGETKRWNIPPMAMDEFGFPLNAPVFGERYKSHADTVTDKAVKAIAALNVTGVNQKNAESAREAGNLVINPFAHLREAPETLRKKGRAVNAAPPVAEAAPLSHIQAAKRLRGLNPAPWDHDAASCMAAVKRLYPDAVPESALDALAVTLARTAPVDVAAIIKPETLIRLEPAETIAGAS